MRVLLTGATGFLGRRLAPRLLAAGYRVRALVRPGSDTGVLPAGVELAATPDIGHRDGLRAAVRGCAAVVHAAGYIRFWGPLPVFWQTNVAGAAAVLAAARAEGVERVVQLSSVTVVGRTDPARVLDETHPCRPLDFYQRTKLEAERLALAYHERAGLDVVVLRPGAFYGPGGHYGFNRLFFAEPLAGWRIRVDGGRRLIMPVYVDDVAAAVLLALERGRAGQVYNVCDEPLSHNAANDTISDLAGIGRWRFDMPRAAVLGLSWAWTYVARYTGREPFYPYALRHYVFQDWPVSSRRARRELGFRPTPFSEGARATLEWYRRLSVSEA